MTADLERLEALARAAGGSQWAAYGKVVRLEEGSKDQVAEAIYEVADYIAAANPAVILDLIAQLRTAATQAKALVAERNLLIIERNAALVRAITAEHPPVTRPVLIHGGQCNVDLEDLTLLLEKSNGQMALERISEPEPEWIVNDLGELGVKVGARFYFLYKGDNIEYKTGLHDDGTPMLWRQVGKREFGETCWPLKWVTAGVRERRYTQELAYYPGLSFGQPGDADWRPLPIQPDPNDTLPLKPLPLNLPVSLDLVDSEGGHHD